MKKSRTIVQFLHAAGGLELEVKCTPQYCINAELADYLKLEPASRFKNAIMN